MTPVCAFDMRIPLCQHASSAITITYENNRIQGHAKSAYFCTRFSDAAAFGYTPRRAAATPADSAIARLPGEPHRRRRGDRAARVGGEGTGGECLGCGSDAGAGRDRGW